MSNQFLLTVCNWLTIIGALFAFLGAIGRPYFSKQVEQEKEAQHTNTIVGLKTDITTSQQALEAERDKVVHLERQNAVIRSLGAELQVEFQGSWQDNPFPLEVLSAASQFYVYLKSSHKSDIYIKLYSAESYELKETQAGKGIFQARQNVKIGQFPLGNQRDVLLSFDIVGIHIPFITYEKFRVPT